MACCRLSCCRGYDEEDRVTSRFLSRRSHTAISPHTCVDCPKAIMPGEKYIREVGLIDGDLVSLAWHIACDAERYYPAW